MKAKFNYKSKKFVISVVIIAILLAVAITGTVLLVRSNSRTEAVTETSSRGSSDNIREDNENPSDDGTTNPETQEPGENEGEAGDIENPDETEEPGEETGDVEGEEPETEVGVVGGAGAGGAAGEEIIVDTDATTIIEYVDEERLVAQSRSVSWEPTEFSLNGVAANLDVNKSRLDVKKEVSNEPANGVEFVYGETIEYVITVTNTGTIAQDTVFVHDLLTGDLVELANVLPSEVITLSFRYVVGENEIINGSVVNTVEVLTPNGTDDTDEVETIPEDIRKELEVIKTFVAFEDVSENTTVNVEELSEEEKANIKVGLNDVLTYKVVVENKGNVTVNNITATDELIKNEDGTLVVKEVTPSTLGPGEKGEVTFAYVVTEADIINGEVLNTATVTGEVTLPNEETEDPEDKITEKVEENSNEEDVITEDVDKTISVDKKLTAVNGSEEIPETVGLNDKLTYTVTVKNKGNVTVEKVEVSDPISNEKTQIIEAIKPSEEATVEFTYTVVEEDIKAGKIVNTATAKVPGEKEVPGTEETPTDDVDLTDLTVVKEFVSYLDASENNVEKTATEETVVDLGDKLTYVITITNNSNVTVHNVEVTDMLEDATLAQGENNPILSIAPGASSSVRFEYVVDSEDIKNGKVENTATATGTVNVPDPTNPDNPPTEEEITGKVEKPEVVETEHNLIINYVYKDGSKAEDSYAETLKAGENYSVESPEIAGYLPNKDVVTGTMPAADVTIDVVYEAIDYTLTINYVDTEGNVLSTAHTETLNINDTYSVKSPVVEGYSLVNAEQETVAGTMPAADVTIDVVYEAIDYTLTINYVDTEGNVLSTAHTETLNINDNYSVESPVVEGYSLVNAEQETVAGTMPAADVTIDVVYEAIDYTLTINYVDTEGNVLSTAHTETLNINDNYSVESPVVEGYSLVNAEQETVAGTMPAADVIVDVVYEAIDYTLTINYVDTEGNVLSTAHTETLNINDTYSVKSPVVEGYSLVNAKQETVAGTMPAADVTIDVVYEAIDYTLTINYVDTEGNVLSTAHTEILNINDNYSVKSPVVEGYSLVDAKQETVAGTMPAADVTIDVVYEAIDYTLTINYVDTEGNVLSTAYTETLNINDNYSVKSPVVEGYSLVNAEQETVAGTMPAADVTIDVVYEAIDYTLTINYVDTEGNVLAEKYEATLNINDNYSVESPVVEGYSLVSAEQETVAGTMPAADVTIDVVYEAIDYTLTINYVDTEGNVLSTAHTETLNINDNYSVKSPVVEGYSLVNAEHETVAGTMPAEDVTIDVVYEAIDYTLTINYVDTEGNVLAEKYEATLNINDNYSVKSPVVEGYSLVNAEQETVTGTMPAEDVTIDVVYEAIDYTLTINYVDTEGNVLAEKYEATLNINDNYSVESPVVEGYSLVNAEQETVAGTMPAADVTIDVVYEVIDYTLTINYVDTEGNVLAEKYEATLNINDNYSVKSPVVEGYSLVNAEQETVAGTMPAADITVDVVYEINKYTVTFVDEDGTVLKEATEYAYGTKAEDIVKPADPTKESDGEYAYSFKGWTPVIVDVTADAVYVAEYESIQLEKDVTLSKAAVDANGKEVAALYNYKVGEIVRFKLTIENTGEATINTYTVTDELKPELSFSGEQPEGTSLSEDERTLTWTVSNLKPGEIREVIITTAINDDAWSTDPKDIYNDIDSYTITNTSSKSEYCTARREYETIVNYKDSNANCLFSIYRPTANEIPLEEGKGATYPNSNYTHVGFGRVTGIAHSGITTVDDLNQVIEAHNKVCGVIEYAPEYVGLKSNETILWYVSKVEGGNLHGINVKYHVDGIIVNLENVYEVTNTITGSDEKDTADVILVKDAASTGTGGNTSSQINYTVNYYKDDTLAETETLSATASAGTTSITVDVEGKNYTYSYWGSQRKYSLSSVTVDGTSNGTSLSNITVTNGTVINVYYVKNSYSGGWSSTRGVMTAVVEDTNNGDLTTDNVDTVIQKIDEVDSTNNTEITIPEVEDVIIENTVENNVVSENTTVDNTVENEITEPENTIENEVVESNNTVVENEVQNEVDNTTAENIVENKAVESNTTVIENTDNSISNDTGIIEQVKSVETEIVEDENEEIIEQ